MPNNYSTKVSIVVPVYRAETSIKKCVDSIVAQTFSDFELILVDDGSPDGSGAICDAYALSDSRVICIHKENGGVSSARNAGLDKAKGEYVVFVDSDDYVHRDYVKFLYECRQDLVVCGVECRNNSEEVLFSVCLPEGCYKNKNDIPFAELYQKNAFYSPYCKLFRTDIIKENRIYFPSDISWGEDGMFVADYIAHIGSLRTIPEVLYYYVRYDEDSSLSTRVRPDIIDMVVHSREYCIQKMAITAPWVQERVRDVCQEDIRRNCADFVVMLLSSKAMTWKRKITMLEKFLTNSYVHQTVAQAHCYYVKHDKVRHAVAQENARKIINSYRKITRRDRALQWAYNAIYLHLPENVKDIYRRMKGRTR